MFLVNQTRYTYDVLYAFNKRHTSFWRPLFIVMLSVVDVLMIALLILTYAVDQADATTTVMSVIIILLATYRLLQYTLLLTRFIRRQAEENIVSTIRFTEEGMDAEVSQTHQEQSSHTAYAAILKVTESADAYYIYLNRRSAFIVSKQGFTEGTEVEFRILLQEKVDTKKLKINL